MHNIKHTHVDLVEFKIVYKRKLKIILLFSNYLKILIQLFYKVNFSVNDVG